MAYLQDIYHRNDTAGLPELVRESEVRRLLEEVGYTIVAFDTQYPRVRWKNADTYLSLETHSSKYPRSTEGLSNFEAMLFRTTAGLVLLDANVLLGRELQVVVDESPKFDRYQIINFILDNLSDAAFLRGPKFIFAHIGSPHEPYIFSQEGQFVPDQDDYIPGYRDAVIYVNARVLSAVDSILANSTSPPIIILQGDHGGSETQSDSRRMHILNAYYLPDRGAAQLYPSITPVNSFRLILDAYLGAKLGLLPDVSYFSDWTDNFDFRVVPNTRPGCESENTAAPTD